MAYIYDLTDTWNAGGTTFNAIKMNVTDSASAAGSKLVTLQTNGTEHFSVTKAGVGYFSSDGLFGLSTASSSRRLRIYGCTATAAASSLQLMTSTSGTGVSDGFTLELDGNEAYVWNYETANIRFGTANTERMRIDASGNVGIGTSSPAVKLEVASANAITSLRVDTENAGVSANNYSEIALADNNAVRTWWRNVRDGTGKTAFGYNDHLAFLSDAGGTPTERMRITSAGNVGIGTSSPTSISNYKAITLDATTGTFIDFRENGTNRLRIGGDGGTAFINGASGALRLLTSDVERLRIDSSGNVGIGTSSPARTLSVYSTSSIPAQIESSGADARISIFTSSGSGGQGFVQASSGALLLGSSNTERMRIDSSGNLLVGTTSVNGDGVSVKPRASAGSTSQINFNRASSATTGYPIVFQNGGTDVGYISHNNTTTTYATSSDARLKHNIIDAPEASALIDQIKVRSFKWNADDSEQRYGFVAQELLPVAPEAVSQPADPEEMMGVDYSKLVPMLVKEIQSLRARVAQLEGN